MPRDLSEILDEVNDRTTFLEFVKALQVDRAAEDQIELETPSPPFGPGANGWENGSISAYLGALHAWGVDNPVGEEPSWQNFARLLYAGKIYE